MIWAPTGVTLNGGGQLRRAVRMAETARREVDAATVAEVRAILDDYEHREEKQGGTEAA